jgi:hypothetical protein
MTAHQQQQPVKGKEITNNLNKQGTQSELE